MASLLTMESRGEGSGASASCGGEMPWIFLSHSGAQKGDFVTHLYHALLHVNHRPFFDKDTLHSLPIGEDYPPHIFEACHTCKMGVVVLSEDYVRNFWPMLELQLLLLPSSSDRRIFPLFYKLQPADLSNPEKLALWKAHWPTQAPEWKRRMTKLQASTSLRGFHVNQLNLDISSLADNLKKLQCRSGEVRNVISLYNGEARYIQSDYDYIHDIVSKICAVLPPPGKYSMDDAIKGGGRMAQEIEEAFMKEKSLGADGVRAIGVHGIGGSGKTTVCKAMNRIQIGLQRKNIFLALDNVWGPATKKPHGFDYAK